MRSTVEITSYLKREERQLRHALLMRLLQVLRVEAVAQVLRALQRFRATFERVVFARFKLNDSGLVDIKADGSPVLTEFDSQWEANVAQADNSDGFVLKTHKFDFLVFCATSARPHSRNSPDFNLEPAQKSIR